MKVKKYEATTEQEAIEMVKDELGLDALVLSIKKTEPRGIFAFFKKSLVEVTAAYDEKTGSNVQTERLANSFTAQLQKTELDNGIGEGGLNNDPANMRLDNTDKYNIGNEKDEKIKQLERQLTRSEQNLRQYESKLSETEQMLSNVYSRLSVANRSETDDENKERYYENNLLQLFYGSLTKEGVLPEVAHALLKEAVDSNMPNTPDKDKIDINLTIKIVYTNIMRILGETSVPNLFDGFNGDTNAHEPAGNSRPAKKWRNRSKRKVLPVHIFIGPTGVGKTTTIAKLASKYVLEGDRSVGLITADTYRIAAVEQLKTYAEILGIDVFVAYSPAEIADGITKLRSYSDMIIVDTAGRSHKSEEGLGELSEALAVIPDENKQDSQVFLVLSLTTKYEDLLSIIDAYSKITDFSIIFTKMDETLCLGTLLNICYCTGKRVAYITNGQNVPEDIEEVRPDKLVKALLGLA